MIVQLYFASSAFLASIRASHDALDGSTHPNSLPDVYQLSHDYRSQLNGGLPSYCQGGAWRDVPIDWYYVDTGPTIYFDRDAYIAQHYPGYEVVGNASFNYYLDPAVSVYGPEWCAPYNYNAPRYELRTHSVYRTAFSQCDNAQDVYDVLPFNNIFSSQYTAPNTMETTITGFYYAADIWLLENTEPSLPYSSGIIPLLFTSVKGNIGVNKVLSKIPFIDVLADRLKEV